MASPTVANGTVQLNYGSLSRTEGFSVTLEDLALADEFKNINFTDGRVLEASDDTLARGNIALGKVGLVIIKNLCSVGDLHVDLNYVSSFVADLIIPPGGVNVVNSAQTGAQPIKLRAPLGTTTTNVTSVATDGTIVFDSGMTAPCECIVARTGGGGSGTDPYLVKVTSENAGSIYDLGGSKTVDLNTGSVYTSTTALSVSPFIDYRTIVTEM
jgi:hypothetical protein